MRNSAEGLDIESGGESETVRVWEADGGSGEPLRGHCGVMGAVAMSADGSRIVQGEMDGPRRSGMRTAVRQ
jgi:hypothetical protein